MSSFVDIALQEKFNQFLEGYRAIEQNYWECCSQANKDFDYMLPMLHGAKMGDFMKDLNLRLDSLRYCVYVIGRSLIHFLLEYGDCVQFVNAAPAPVERADGYAESMPDMPLFVDTALQEDFSRLVESYQAAKKINRESCLQANRDYDRILSTLHGPEVLDYMKKTELCLATLHCNESQSAHALIRFVVEYGGCVQFAGAAHPSGDLPGMNRCPAGGSLPKQGRAGSLPGAAAARALPLLSRTSDGFSPC